MVSQRGLMMEIFDYLSGEFVRGCSFYLSRIDPIATSLCVSMVALLVSAASILFVVRQTKISRSVFENRLAKIAHLILSLTKAIEARESKASKESSDMAIAATHLHETSEEMSQALVQSIALLKRLESEGLLG